MNTYFTSDLHFYHKNIVKYTGRPTTTENLNRWIIEQINAKVKPKDTVYHLGDFAFVSTADEISKILRSLNGNWKFILGNHDRARLLIDGMENTYGSHEFLGSYHELRRTEIGDVILCHYPLEVWNKQHHGAKHLHGHLHGNTSLHGGGKLTVIKNRLDCGIDNHPKFTVYSMDELKQIFNGE